MIGGLLLQQRWSAQRCADGINFWPNAVLAFNYPSGEQNVCLSFFNPCSTTSVYMFSDGLQTYAQIIQFELSIL